MGRGPCCDKANVKRGAWSPEEDAILKSYMHKHGSGGNWITLPTKAGLRRCGKSCRLRWLNYLRPDIKHGGFTEEEDNVIFTLYAVLGSRWSLIASRLPGRTDNDVKNHWNTKLKKKLLSAGQTARLRSDKNQNLGGLAASGVPKLETHDDHIVDSSSYCFYTSSFSALPQLLASRLPGRTDNDVKNHWNTKLKKKLLSAGQTARLRSDKNQNLGGLAASGVPKLETHDDHIVDSSSYCFYTSSFSALPQLHMSPGHQEYSSFDHQDQKAPSFLAPNAVESSDLGTGGNNFGAASSTSLQEVSSLSTASSSLAFRGNDEVNAEEEEEEQIFLDFDYDFLNGFWS